MDEESEECVQCTRRSRGTYMGFPCCMHFDCMSEIKHTEDTAEKIARQIFGQWLKKVFKLKWKGEAENE